MNFNDHSDLEGSHAFLSGSRYHWIHYDEDRLRSSYTKFLATQKGTNLHNLAAILIKNKIKLPRTKYCLNRFVNDAIDLKMVPEQVLYYSNNAFGTADTISFEDYFLRIHDLKTGLIPGSIHQLEIYGALFCLEYHIFPADIRMEFRIYQFNDVIIFIPEVDQIIKIMSKIKLFDTIIERERGR